MPDDDRSKKLKDRHEICRNGTIAVKLPLRRQRAAQSREEWIVDADTHVMRCRCAYAGLKASAAPNPTHEITRSSLLWDKRA